MDSINILNNHLKTVIHDEHERENIEQFILVLFFDILAAFSSISIDEAVKQVVDNNFFELELFQSVEGLALNNVADQQRELIEKLFGLIVFSFGPDYEDQFGLRAQNKHSNSEGIACYHIEKYFFTELISVLFKSHFKELDNSFHTSFILILK